jgi:hypothetical protein
LHVKIGNFLNRIKQLVTIAKDIITISTALVRIVLMNISTSTNIKSDYDRQFTFQYINDASKKTLAADGNLKKENFCTNSQYRTKKRL